MNRTLILNLFVLLGIVVLPTSLWADNPAEEAIIFSLTQSHPLQERTQLIIDSRLSQAAQARADDMAARSYFSHTNPDGLGPNYIAQNVYGYTLPSFYDMSAAGNNIESIAFEQGYPSTGMGQRFFNGWLNSPGHRRQILAEDDFSKAQNRVGIGITSVGNKTYGVFLSAPCAPNPTDTWSVNRANAGSYYSYFIGQGNPNAALAWYYYFTALADRDYYNAFCFEQYAQLLYWQGLAYYEYTINNRNSTGARRLYQYFGNAYYYYYVALGNPSYAAAYYTYYNNLASSIQ